MDQNQHIPRHNHPDNHEYYQEILRTLSMGLYIVVQHQHTQTGRYFAPHNNFAHGRAAQKEVKTQKRSLVKINSSACSFQHTLWETKLQYPWVRGTSPQARLNGHRLSFDITDSSVPAPATGLLLMRQRSLPGQGFHRRPYQRLDNHKQMEAVPADR